MSQNIHEHYGIEHRGSGRMFKSNFLEKFSRTHWSAPLVFYVPLAIAAIIYAELSGKLSLVQNLATVAGAFFFWSFAEYFLHRYVFHWTRFEKLHYLIHGIHHNYPNDTSRIVLPLGASLVIAIPLALVCYFFGSNHGYSFFAGFSLGYVWYEMSHVYTHIGKPKGGWGERIKKHHMKHHFLTPNHRFGVSSDLWDLVFGTIPERRNEKTQVPTTPESPDPSA